MGPNHIDPHIREEVVKFLRDWLPASAIRAYREMIQADPDHWSRHPHFQGGVIVDHALRGNGITEEVLGIEDLEQVWPELLRLAVEHSNGARGSPGSEPGEQP